MGALPAYSFGRRTPYHRTLLDEDSQKLYDLMLSTLKTGATSFDTDSSSIASNTNMLSKILAGVLNDHPLLFWADGSIRLRISGSTTNVSIGVNNLYDDREKLISLLEDKCFKIHNSISESFSCEYGASLELHDYLANSIQYEDTGVRSHCAIGPLIDGKGVCEGIADAYNLLMNTFGIRCTKVNGHAWKNADIWHSWNISIIDGHAYHTDVTFDLGGMHRFLNLDDDIMALTHRFNRFIQCDSKEANYHYRNGTLFDTVDESDRYLKRKVNRNGFTIEFVVLEGSSIKHYRDLMKNVMSGGTLTIEMSEDERAFILTLKTTRNVIDKLTGHLLARR